MSTGIDSEESTNDSQNDIFLTAGITINHDQDNENDNDNDSDNDTDTDIITINDDDDDDDDDSHRNSSKSKNIISDLDKYKYQHETGSSTTMLGKRMYESAVTHSPSASATLTAPLMKKIKANTLLHGLAPIIAHASHHPPPTHLILGSMPSEASLLGQRYYDYKYNAFWSVMSKILTYKDFVSSDYETRKEQLIMNGIAVWDVIQSCCRNGSLDTSIKNPKINNFDALLTHHPTIHTIVNNGGTSSTLFHKHVINNNSCIASQLIKQRNIRVVKAPSTSPAHAMANAVEVKSSKWKEAMYPTVTTTTNDRHDNKENTIVAAITGSSRDRPSSSSSDSHSKAIRSSRRKGSRKSPPQSNHISAYFTSSKESSILVE